MNTSPLRNWKTTSIPKQFFSWETGVHQRNQFPLMNSKLQNNPKILLCCLCKTHYQDSGPENILEVGLGKGDACKRMNVIWRVGLKTDCYSLPYASDSPCVNLLECSMRWGWWVGWLKDTTQWMCYNNKASKVPLILVIVYRIWVTHHV